LKTYNLTNPTGNFWVSIGILPPAVICSCIRNIQLFELGIQPDNDEFGMTACGMIVIDPPWTLFAEMQQALPWLAETLGQNRQGHSGRAIGCRVGMAWHGSDLI
jgi:hypothetical protein